jgi:hypothetical protein
MPCRPERTQMTNFLSAWVEMARTTPEAEIFKAKYYDTKKVYFMGFYAFGRDGDLGTLETWCPTAFAEA